MNKDAVILCGGGVGIIPTDTLYGIVGQALKRNTVERIYQLKRRSPLKPFIILIGDISDLKQFGITADNTLKTVLDQYWPGPVSVIMDCSDPNLEYLHRGTNTLAFRLPAKPELTELLRMTGPLVAPSANPEGKLPAKNIDDAKAYFDGQIDFCIKGQVNTKPSKIIKITSDNKEEVIRP
jgi:L-threonylcarbamoyladenylate synthase